MPAMIDLVKMPDLMETAYYIQRAHEYLVERLLTIEEGAAEHETLEADRDIRVCLERIAAKHGREVADAMYDKAVRHCDEI